jgi:hypothetical protein
VVVLSAFVWGTPVMSLEPRMPAATPTPGCTVEVLGCEGVVVEVELTKCACDCLKNACVGEVSGFRPTQHD